MWPSGPVTHYNIPSQKKKNPCIFQSLGRSPGTIRPLVKFFAFLLSLDRLPTTIWSISKKKNRLSPKWLVLSVKVMCQSTVFKVFKTKKIKKKQKFFLYLIFFINLLHKAKRKWNFLISLHSKYYKEWATIITQFLNK